MDVIAADLCMVYLKDFQKGALRTAERSTVPVLPLKCFMLCLIMIFKLSLLFFKVVLIIQGVQGSSSENMATLFVRCDFTFQIKRRGQPLAGNIADNVFVSPDWSAV